MPELANMQESDGKAKLYQMKQFVKPVECHNLKVDAIL